MSQMSGVHGKMQLVLSSREAGQANCAIPHCSSADLIMTLKPTPKMITRLIFALFRRSFVADILIYTGELSQ